MSLHPEWLVPDWQEPSVGAVMTTRHGGSSLPPFDSMNLRDAVGDDPQAVIANQDRLAAAIGARPVFLNQVHGARVARLGRADADGVVHDADASITTEPGIACVVQVADCLPVLFAGPQGRVVGAAHAGWRGLSQGVLEATVDAMCSAAGCHPHELQAWLGPCIGPRQFEVGRDVLEAFGAVGQSTDAVPHDASPASADGAVVDLPRFRQHRPGKWLAHLPLLARDRLDAKGVSRISGGNWCTVESTSSFFSFRRDRVTGRMAALVWIRGSA